VKEVGCVEQRQNSTAHLKIQHVLRGNAFISTVIAIRKAVNQSGMRAIGLLGLVRRSGPARGLARGRTTGGLNQAGTPSKNLLLLGRRQVAKNRALVADMLGMAEVAVSNDARGIQLGYFEVSALIIIQRGVGGRKHRIEERLSGGRIGRRRSETGSRSSFQLPDRSTRAGTERGSAGTKEVTWDTLP